MAEASHLRCAPSRPSRRGTPTRAVGAIPRRPPRDGRGGASSRSMAPPIRDERGGGARGVRRDAARRWRDRVSTICTLASPRAVDPRSSRAVESDLALVAHLHAHRQPARRRWCQPHRRTPTADQQVPTFFVQPSHTSSGEPRQRTTSSRSARAARLRSRPSSGTAPSRTHSAQEAQASASASFVASCDRSLRTTIFAQVQPRATRRESSAQPPLQVERRHHRLQRAQRLRSAPPPSLSPPGCRRPRLPPPPPPPPPSSSSSSSSSSEQLLLGGGADARRSPHRTSSGANAEAIGIRGGAKFREGGGSAASSCTISRTPSACEEPTPSTTGDVASSQRCGSQQRFLRRSSSPWLRITCGRGASLSTARSNIAKPAAGAVSRIDARPRRSRAVPHDAPDVPAMRSRASPRAPPTRSRARRRRAAPPPRAQHRRALARARERRADAARAEASTTPRRRTWRR